MDDWGMFDSEANSDDSMMRKKCIPKTRPNPSRKPMCPSEKPAPRARRNHALQACVRKNSAVLHRWRCSKGVCCAMRTRSVPCLATSGRSHSTQKNPAAFAAGLTSLISTTTGESNPSHAQILHHQIIINPEVRPFTPQSRLLHAAKRRDFIGDEPGIDPHHARLQPFCHTPDAADIA